MNQLGVTTDNDFENLNNMFGAMNPKYFNRDLGNFGSTGSDSMTGSVDVSQRELKVQYQIGINKVISKIISSITDTLLLPEYLANLFDHYVEFYIVNWNHYYESERQSEEYGNYSTLEHIYYQLRKYIPNFKIYPHTIDKISGAIQFNRINHDVISRDFIENLIENSMLLLEKQSNIEVLASLLKLQKIKNVKNIVLNKQKRQYEEFQNFLLEP